VGQEFIKMAANQPPLLSWPKVLEEGDFFVKRSTRIFFFKPIAEAVQPGSRVNLFVLAVRKARVQILAQHPR
jgi:hypothetical protein